MTKTNDSGVWDQDPVESGRVGSGFMKRTPNVKQVAKVVRDDWDDDDDDDDASDDGGAHGVKETHQANKAKESGNRTDSTAPVPCPTAARPRREQAAPEQHDDEESSKIWEEANKRAPMPELIVAPASTSQSFPPPPPAAFQPTLRILKRPSPNASASVNNVGTSSPMSSSGPASSSGSGGTSSAPPRGTLSEREAQYQEARSRIFGDKDKVGIASPGSMSRTSSSSGVVVVRDPLGPASESELDPGTGGQDRACCSDRPAKGFGERRRGNK